MTKLDERMVLPVASSSWSDLQGSHFLFLPDGSLVWHNGLWVRDRSANIGGMMSGPGWRPEGVATTDQFGWDKTGALAVNHSAVTTYLRAYGAVWVKRGTYLHSGEVYNVTNDCLIMNDGFDGGVNLLSMSVSKSIQLVVKTPNTAPVSTKDSRVGYAINVTALGEQHGTGFRADLYNQSTDGQGNTGFYGQAVHAGHWSAALHGENKHGLGGTSMAVSIETATYTASGSPYGIVLNNVNKGAPANHPITGEPKTFNPNLTGVLLTGASNEDVKNGWVKGTHFRQNSMHPTLGIGFHFEASMAYLARIDKAASQADFLFNDNGNNGIVFGGVYAGSAIRLAEGNKVAFGNDSTLHFTKVPGQNLLGFYSGANLRAAIGWNESNAGLHVLGQHVVKAPRTGWTAATGTSSRASFDPATVTTQQLAERVKALIDDLMSHHKLLSN